MFKKTSEYIKKAKTVVVPTFLKNLDLSQNLMIYFLEVSVVCNEASFTNAPKYQGRL